MKFVNCVNTSLLCCQVYTNKMSGKKSDVKRGAKVDERCSWDQPPSVIRCEIVVRWVNDSGDNSSRGFRVCSVHFNTISRGLGEFQEHFKWSQSVSKAFQWVPRSLRRGDSECFTWCQDVLECLLGSWSRIYKCVWIVGGVQVVRIWKPQNPLEPLIFRLTWNPSHQTLRSEPNSASILSWKSC